MADLASHLLRQGNMYPVFPAATDACLDFSHWQQLQLHTMPELLVLPSQMAPGAKIVAQPVAAAEDGAPCCLSVMPARH